MRDVNARIQNLAAIYARRANLRWFPALVFPFILHLACLDNRARRNIHNSWNQLAVCNNLNVNINTDSVKGLK